LDTLGCAQKRVVSAESSHVQVVVVDDSPPFRDLLKDVVNATPGMTCVGALSSGADAVAAVERSAPDLVIIDKRMPQMDGIEASREILARAPETVVVLVSVEQPEAKFLQQSGAVAFLNKRDVSSRALAEIWEQHGP
jgi:DNA-binding NarL/FixJ family response regulator